MKLVRIAVILGLGLATLSVFAAVSRDINDQIHRWFAKSSAQIMAEVRAKEARVHELGLVGVHYNTPEVPVNPKALLATDNPYAKELGTAHPATAYRRLMDLNDDRAARRTARAIAWSCVVFAPAMVDDLRKAMDKTQVTPEIRKIQEATLERESMRCVDFSSDDIRRENGLYRSELEDRKELLYAMYDAGRQSAEVMARLRAMAELKDPVALEIAGRANGFSAPPAPLDKFDLGGGKSIGAGHLYVAFQLAACEYGANCGASRVAGDCVAQGKCYRNFEEQALAPLEPAQRENVLAARDVILKGVETKKWPAGWWDTPALKTSQS